MKRRYDPVEPGPLALVALDSDDTVVAFDDLFRYGKANACAFEFVFWV